MKAHVLAEPELEFRAGNRHIDPRYGVAVFGPADADAPTAPREIPVGIIGAPAAIEGARRWLQRCQTPITAKDAKPGQENLFPEFPGFSLDSPFGAQLVFDDTLLREIPDRQLRQLAKADTKSAVTEAVTLYAEAARSLAETGRCRIIICARPDQLNEAGSAPPAHADTGLPDEADSDGDKVDIGGDFHDRLKAVGLALPCPLQLMRSETWTGTRRRTATTEGRPLQDEATRAWNLHTALYYKAGGTPWRRPRHSTDIATCHIGISFYRTTDQTELHTAVAQVFNERGDGVVVRGGAATVDKADRQPHLSADAARALLVDALTTFRRTHGHPPARVVLHKTSRFSDHEQQGFYQAADEKEIDSIELLWIQRRAAPRLFRTGQLPPLRGTTLQLDDHSIVVYTRGSIEYFRTYPGMYVPQPLLIRTVGDNVELGGAAADVLALSKMNWNNAQLDERDPLTLRTASRVGNILKHVPAGTPIANRYAYYM